MIKKILENCSEAELGNILGWEILKFAKEITENQLDINNLSNAVFLTVGIDLIKNNNYRDLIISRMSIQQVDNVISAFIKSMRASQPNAAIYYLARMVEAGQDPLYIARRMVIFASEDIGQAQPTALVVHPELSMLWRQSGSQACLRLPAQPP